MPLIRHLNKQNIPQDGHDSHMHIHIQLEMSISYTERLAPRSPLSQPTFKCPQALPPTHDDHHVSSRSPSLADPVTGEDVASSTIIVTSSSSLPSDGSAGSLEDGEHGSSIVTSSMVVDGGGNWDEEERHRLFHCHSYIARGNNDVMRFALRWNSLPRDFAVGSEYCIGLPHVHISTVCGEGSLHTAIRMGWGNYIYAYRAQQTNWHMYQTTLRRDGLTSKGFDASDDSPKPVRTILFPSIVKGNSGLEELPAKSSPSLSGKWPNFSFRSFRSCSLM